MNVELEYSSFQDFANRLWPCLSEEGMWVRSDRPAGVGELVDFDVMLADGFRLFHGTGQVIAVGSGPEAAGGGLGMTIRFSQLDDPSRNLIRKVVRKHAGEGGQPFVLSAPATKVEVVGDEARQAEEAAEAPDDSSRPDDLLAPFPDLESDVAWAGQSEPELTSFLRASGRSTELELGEGPEEEGGGEAPREAEGGSGSEDVSEEEIAGLESQSTEAPETPEAPEASEAPEAPEAAGAPEAGREPEPPVEEPPYEPQVEEPPYEPPVEELPFEEPPEARREPSLADTQAVEPWLFDDPGSPTEFSTPPDVEPMHSTVVPPAIDPPELPDEVPFDAGDLLADEASAATGSKWWVWALAGALAFVVGIFAIPRVLDMGTEQSPPPAETRPAVGGDRTPTSGGVGAGSSAESTAPAPAPVEIPQGSPLGDEDEVMADEVSAAAPEPEQESPADRTAAEPAAAPPPVPAPAPPAVEPSVPADPPVAVGERVRLERITWSERDGDTVVRLWLDGSAAPARVSTLRVAEGDPRWVIRLTGVAGDVPSAPVPIGSPHVERLRFGVHATPAGRQLHVVADLVDETVELRGAVRLDDSAVEIRFGRPGG